MSEIESKTSDDAKSVCVLVKLDDDKIYQVLLNKDEQKVILEMIGAICGCIKVLGEPIDSIEIKTMS